MRIDVDIKLDFKDVLIRPKRSTLTSRKDVKLVRSYEFKNSGQTWSGVPIVSSNMDTTGTFETAFELQEHQMFTCIHKHYGNSEWVAVASRLNPEYFAVSSGITDKDITNLFELVEFLRSTAGLYVKFICLDVANGYQEVFTSAVRKVHEKYPDKVIIAGNVVTGEMVEELILAGADIVKVGIGGGSVCTTRKQTGVGYPQLSAIIECADAAHGLGGHVMSDGGCTVPGDLGKAFGGGADFVMLGGMMAGHAESCGDLIEEEGKQFKVFYGMSSDTAMKKHHGGINTYRSSEGKTVKIPYRGPLRGTVLDMLGGLRSTCTYVGAVKLKELSKRTTFIRVTQQLNNIFS